MDANEAEADLSGKARHRSSGSHAAATRAAPALEKGLDILELLCQSAAPMSQKEIAQRLGRSVSELYRMLLCLVERGYVVSTDERYAITTKLFELAHASPPTRRLLIAAEPIMQRLSDALDQSCHLTVYHKGRQIALAKVDSPSGIGYSIRVGAELDVIVSASGRVHLAFQDETTTRFRIEEALRRRPDHAVADIAAILEAVRRRGFESIPSIQVRGLHAASFPVLGANGYAIAALTVPFAERIDQPDGVTMIDVERELRAAAHDLSIRMGASVSEGH
ncbi:MAG: IclR family transcriptional regulator [Pikeienuella sp.]|uniref:IclR family transcriptional regulator n=1 Tax=Pikeienuella sp. TaxID=2831957 RepID=UPI00391D4809